MSMSYHIKQRGWYNNFLPKRLILLETAKLDIFVLSEWRKQQTYRKYVNYLELRQRGTLF